MEHDKRSDAGFTLAGFTLDRWRRLWRRLNLQGDGDAVFRRLRRAHGQWWRAYHDAVHVADCLAWLDRVQGEPKDPDLLEMAFWFHDAVYVPWLPRNEERSAAWAERVLRRAGLGEERLRTVTELILATRHGHGTEGRGSEPADRLWMVDIDLSILGAEPERFGRYERQIRQEYRWVGATRFRRGRRAVLESFLAADAVYSTDWFRARLESRAQANLKRALDRLR